MSGIDQRLTKVGRNMMKFDSPHARFRTEPTKAELRDLLREAVENTNKLNEKAEKSS